MIKEVKKPKLHRIGTMIDAVTKAATGDVSIRLETSNENDELNLLAAAINALLDSVQEGQTQPKQADDAPQETKIRYNRLYESLMDAFATVDMNGRIREANCAFQELLGYTEEELRQLACKDITPEEWHAFEQRIFEEQVMVYGYSEIYEKEYRRKDGAIFPVELRTFLIRDDDKQPAGMWAIIRDISSRKKSEKTLQMFQFSIDQAPDAVYWMDQRGTFFTLMMRRARRLVTATRNC
jgi:PAS domain S-box-containing protein